MTEVRFVAYYRVSTDRQGRSGLGLEAQQKAVADFIAQGSGDLVTEYTEVESGKRNNRAELAEALAACRKHKAVLLLARLDRLARNVAFVANLLEAGTDFIALDMPEADRTFLQMAAVFAEWEGLKISERTKAALAAAKARGTRLGSPVPEKGSALGVEAQVAEADRFAGNAAPVIDSIRSAGITNLRGIAEALNARGVQTARGGRWHAATVRNVLNRV